MAMYFAGDNDAVVAYPWMQLVCYIAAWQSHHKHSAWSELQKAAWGQYVARSWHGCSSAGGPSSDSRTVGNRGREEESTAGLQATTNARVSKMRISHVHAPTHREYPTFACRQVL